MRNAFLIILTFLYSASYAQLDVDNFTSDKVNATGVWKSIGDGYLLKIDPTVITLYSYTNKYCYKEQNDYVIDLLNNSSTLQLNPTKDTLSVYLQDFGEKTKTLQDRKRFYKLNSLPQNCAALTAAQQNDSEYLFELFWSTLKENYAFAKERNLDWEQIYKNYRPKITSKTSKKDLFNLFGEIVTQTKDQHTKIISKEDGTRQYSGVPTALRLEEVFKQQDSTKNFNDFISLFFKTNYENISNDLLQGNGNKVANGKIEWGSVTPDIGYIHLHSLTGFASNSLSRKQHLDTLNFYMTQIMKSFQYKKAIIVDVSFNFGGYDAAGLTISGYFTARPTPVYTKYIFQNGSFYKGTEFIVTPSATHQFTKPVYVLTSDISRSAAESFVMQMKSLPNVQVVGTNTLGILSDMLGKSIGDYYLTLSNEKYLTPSGKSYEVKGVDVDIKLPVFPKDNMFNGHRDAVSQIIKIIEKK
ncbi:MAG TPA: S41 family peptidase [Chryseolinea sp.]|nr:S41 family peptidase [Chryseolinea sp.]